MGIQRQQSHRYVLLDNVFIISILDINFVYNTCQVGSSRNTKVVYIIIGLLVIVILIAHVDL